MVVAVLKLDKFALHQGSSKCFAASRENYRSLMIQSETIRTMGAMVFNVQQFRGVHTGIPSLPEDNRIGLRYLNACAAG